MGWFLKTVVILGLIYLILGQFTKSKAVRKERRTRTTNILLGILIASVFVTMILQFWK